MNAQERFNQNQRLVGYAMRQLHVKPQGILTWEDYRQAGYLALWRAAQQFDPCKGCAFSTFALAWIKGELMRTRRDGGQCGLRLNREALKRREQVRMVPLDQVSRIGFRQDTDIAMDLNHALSMLNGREREVIRFQLYGLTQVQTAKSMGLSQPAVCRALADGRRKISNYLNYYPGT